MTTIHEHAVVHDARSRRDPTGTSAIRTAFRSEADRRLQHVKNALRRSFNEQNVLGLKGDVPSYAGHALDVASRVRMFGTWFNEEVYRTLVDRDAKWTRSFIQRAYAQGLATARKELGVGDELPTFITSARGRLGVYEEMAYNDLTGIADEMVKLTNRLAADAVVRSAGNMPTCRHCVMKINRVAKSRLQLFANTLTVRAYNDAKLEQYGRLGVNRVGLLSETLASNKPKRMLDQDPLEGRTPLSRRRDLGRGSVEVLTAQDDVVCEDCQALADAGPYNVSQVFGVLPLHPRCRCSWVPYGDPRLEEEFSE